MVCHLPTPEPKDPEIITIRSGAKIVVTEEMLSQIERPYKVPSRGGLPCILVLKRARKRFGSNAFVLPDKQLERGFALFLPRDLKVGQIVYIVWMDAYSAAGVEQGKYDIIRIMTSGTIAVTEEILSQLQRPRRVPERGGLPCVLILKKARKRFGPHAFVLPDKQLDEGHALFLPRYLKVGQELCFPWIDTDSAAAVFEKDLVDFQTQLRSNVRRGCSFVVEG